MENSEELYHELRELYLEKGVKQDSIGKGIAIEKLISRLLSDIASPFLVESHAPLGKYEFDGAISLGRGKTIFYEIELGTVPKFKYYRISETVRSASALYLPRVYVLLIASEFSTNDKKTINDLFERIVSERVKLCFIDYETLIQLHQFSRKLEDTQNLRRIKSLFLEKLFEKNSIVAGSSFNDAFLYAEDASKFGSQVARSVPPRTEVVLIEEPLLENRISMLEEMAERLLSEIRALREELKMHIRGSR